ncbi:MAG: hypothetical protein Ct9H300mP7_2850 [Verrucomicrobiota bacterium]|nr:MAG: hypothetical protein Ct9H300mP7_2850 [Verrucomicrobiota bacterium]
MALVGCGGPGVLVPPTGTQYRWRRQLVAMADAFKDRMDGSLNGLKKKHGLKADVKEGKKVHRFRRLQEGH